MVRNIKPLLLVIEFLIVAPLCAVSPKVLHLTYHKGLLHEFEMVARELKLNLTSKFILNDPRGFDGQSTTNAIYNIGHDRAERIWRLHKDEFEQYDIIVTSDIAPLARIFLQNGWKKPLIIWICNRFDYYDEVTLDCNFPDTEYYDLFRAAGRLPNVAIVSSTPYEYIYAAVKGVPVGSLTINPIGSIEGRLNGTNDSLIPASVDKPKTLILPPMNLFCPGFSSAFIVNECQKHNIPVYSGRYNGPRDLQGFKGILYFPYQWYNQALFENLQLGIIHFVPSQKFIEDSYTRNQLIIKGYQYCCLNPLFYEYSEWYCSEHRDLLVYFDSWDDLAAKIMSTNYIQKRETIKDFANHHRMTMLSRWKKIFEQFGFC